MIRRLVAVGAVVVATAMPTAPTAAYEDVCAFQGLMNTSAPVPTALAVTTVDYTMTVSFGVCAKFLTFASVGTLTGNLAGPTTGTGVVATTGQRYAFTGAGGVVELAGQVVGTMVITPDVPSGTPSTRFIVNVTVALVN